MHLMRSAGGLGMEVVAPRPQRSRPSTALGLVVGDSRHGVSGAMGDAGCLGGPPLSFLISLSQQYAQCVSCQDPAAATTLPW
jgi:hypothetical protein